MDERKLRVYWALCPGLDASTYRKLFAHFGSVRALSEASPDDWLDALRMRPETARKMAAWQEAAPRRAGHVEAELAGAGIECLVQGDASYPKCLLDLFDPPVVLFARGNLDLLAKDDGVAIVGTRRSSSYGTYATKWIASTLARSGIVVYSGMAMGIDACAHQSVLDSGGCAIAVLGCGIDVCYPLSNRPLYRRLSEHGLLLSEYAPRSLAAKHRFPERNRLIAALSRATVVVQAGEKSGALRTAESALELGRDVWVVPGPITSKSFRGSHQLLVDGAIPLVDPIALLGHYGNPVTSAKGSRELSPPQLIPRHLQDLARFLTEEGPLRAGEIALLTATAPGNVHAQLLEMELASLVRRLPDGRYQMDIHV
ncbi:DNA-processing protein DprA [Alicyclobacillus acidoterrestris]|uniref:DNA-processing protein DprA n=1 Tax=Alicyclobacillus acidoterrestris (strain ATCC 49025 / DSM 3922 / CIP 106132 / NCIMB 13137 / GD3B) TaxID=1356854 RepID=T0BZR1_ALIAG|nr:DNA-processing protein DprA [Alicyclobacillus acidoterrestris]EPZ46284.1 hypothetical protein N007_07250 [Alicyclobacillus acidoterrestris ATCC 49025]UNO47090.1 DNA-processing protein DprA [Alicyclobacillus acidoterrestris]